MKILLLGGTGAIGENLVKILYKHSIYTVVTSRRERNNFGSITYVQGNAHDIQFLKIICAERWDAIIDFMSYKTEEFSDRIEMMLSCTNQYVFISSARVYADEEHPIKESSPRLLDVCKNKEYLSTDEYALTKARQENILKQYAFSHNYTIIRPYITYSNNRLQLGVLEKEEWLYRALLGHTVVFTEEIAKRTTTMTSGYDVALGIYNLLGKEVALGETIHLTSEHLMTWYQIIDIYASTFKDVTGLDLKIKMVPLDDFISCRNKDLRWQVIYDRLYDRDFDITKESLYAGSKSFIDPSIGLRNCLTSFLQSNRTFKSQINYKNEARKDQLTGEHYVNKMAPALKMKIQYLIYRYIL